MSSRGGWDSAMKYGYMIGVTLRFCGMALIYLGYLSAQGDVFLDKMRYLGGHKWLVNSSVLIVFSIIQFIFAVRKIKLKALEIGNSWNEEGLELGNVGGGIGGR